MTNTADDELKLLDETLHALLLTHSYSRVLSRLVQIAGEHYQQRLVVHARALDPRFLMTLAPEEREPFIEASMEKTGLAVAPVAEEG